MLDAGWRALIAEAAARQAAVDAEVLQRSENTAFPFRLPG